MKAVFQTSFGNSDVLQYGEVAQPAIKANQVRIRNYATSVNPRDWLIRSGRYQLQFMVPPFPLILGSDFAGEIIEIGSNVTGYHLGDRVYGMKNPTDGLATYAEDLVAHPRNLAKMPTNLSFIEAAGVPLCSLTAWQALNDIAGVQRNDRLLVIGGSGGVGSYAVQIGKALGADVTAVCSEANAAMVKRLGVARTIDYKSQDFLSEQTQYDTIFDTIGKHNWKTCSKVLSRQGCFVSTVPNPANLTSMALSRLRNLVGHSQRSEVVMVSSKGTDLEKLTGLIETGQITPLIDSVFPLKDAKQAHDHSRSLRAKGKIILEVQPQGVRDEQPI